MTVPVQINPLAPPGGAEVCAGKETARDCGCILRSDVKTAKVKGSRLIEGSDLGLNRADDVRFAALQPKVGRNHIVL